MLRRLFLNTRPWITRQFLNIWLWITLSGILFVGHGVWAWWMCSGTPMQRVGAPLIVLGILIAARPFIRVGARAWIEMSLPRLGLFPIKLGEVQRVREAARPEIEKDIRAIHCTGQFW